MGRPLRNANHPLAKLRVALSSDHHRVTRKELAKRVGIPETSLRDIENGKYKLTSEVATRIAYAVGGVSPQSLLAGDDPLLDLLGSPFTKDSPRWPEDLWRAENQAVRQQIFLAGWDVAREKKISLLLAFTFETWILETFQAFGFDELLIERFTDRLHLFDPALAPDKFYPKNKRLAKKWESVGDQIREEDIRIERQDRIDNPDHHERPENSESWSTLTQSESGRAFLREFVIRQKDLRVEAQKRVRQRMEAEMEAAKPKPVSGKRPRSPGRPKA